MHIFPRESEILRDFQQHNASSKSSNSEFGLFYFTYNACMLSACAIEERMLSSIYFSSRKTFI